jgi:hypothetical protein
MVELYLLSLKCVRGIVPNYAQGQLYIYRTYNLQRVYLMSVALSD